MPTTSWPSREVLARLLPILLLLLLLHSCGPADVAPSAPAAPPEATVALPRAQLDPALVLPTTPGPAAGSAVVDEGVLFYSLVSPEQRAAALQFAPELLVADTNGALLRRIPLPAHDERDVRCVNQRHIVYGKVWSKLIAGGSRALFCSGDERLMLLDARLQSAVRLQYPQPVLNFTSEEPAAVEIDPAGGMLHQSMLVGERFALIMPRFTYSPHPYLLNLDSATIVPAFEGIDLLDTAALDFSETIFSFFGAFSPSERYLFLETEVRGQMRLLLVPTSDPRRARALGPGPVEHVYADAELRYLRERQARIHDFSPDESLILYAVGGEAGSAQVVVEGVDGAGSRVVAEGLIDGASFGPEGSVLIKRRGRYALVSLVDLQEREVLAYDPPKEREEEFFLSVDRSMLLVRYGKEPVTWQLVNLSAGSVRVLPIPEHATFHQHNVAYDRVVFYASEADGSGWSYILVDLMTGALQRLVHGPAEKMTGLVQLDDMSEDGRFFLDYTYQDRCEWDVCDFEFEYAWLRPAGGQPPLMLGRSDHITGVHASLAPDGLHAVVSTVEGETATMRSVSTEGGAERSLGEGFGAVWLKP